MQAKVRQLQQVIAEFETRRRVADERHQKGYPSLLFLVVAYATVNIIAFVVDDSSSFI